MPGCPAFRSLGQDAMTAPPVPEEVCLVVRFRGRFRPLCHATIIIRHGGGAQNSGGCRAMKDDMIVPKDYPELAFLCWNRDPARPITGKEALALYERNWRWVRRDRLTLAERNLIDWLVARHGRGVLLV